ncbi:MAG: hypothetical protein ACTSV5_08850 [Promethearchaeota archaeon]
MKNPPIIINEPKIARRPLKMKLVKMIPKIIIKMQSIKLMMKKYECRLIFFPMVEDLFKYLSIINRSIRFNDHENIINTPKTSYNREGDGIKKNRMPKTDVIIFKKMDILLTFFKKICGFFIIKTISLVL